jgi:hypothetical protein
VVEEGGIDKLGQSADVALRHQGDLEVDLQQSLRASLLEARNKLVNG